MVGDDPDAEPERGDDHQRRQARGRGDFGRQLQQPGRGRIKSPRDQEQAQRHDRQRQGDPQLVVMDPVTHQMADAGAQLLRRGRVPEPAADAHPGDAEAGDVRVDHVGRGYVDLRGRQPRLGDQLQQAVPRRPHRGRRKRGRAPRQGEGQPDRGERRRA